MAAITDPAALLASANCFSCFGSDRGTMELLKLALLQQIAIALGIPVANLDPAVLLANSACLNCYAGSPGMAQLMELALLLQIAQNGVGGGGGGTSVLPNGDIFVGNAANVATPVAMSGEGTLTNAGVFTGTRFASGNLALNVTSWTMFIIPALAVAPTKVRCVLVLTADDANSGYQATAGDEIDVSGVFNSNSLAPAFTFHANPNGMRCQSLVAPVGNESQFLIVHKNGGSYVNPSSFNNFAMKLYAAP